MSLDNAAMQTPAISFGGTLNRRQFLLLQQMMLPWWGTMKVTTAATLTVALCFALFDRGVNGASFLDSLEPFVWAAMLLIYVWALTAYGRRRQWRNIQKNQKGIAGTIDDASLQWDTELSKSNLPWSRVAKIRQRPDMLLVFYSDKCAFYLPKDFFATESAWNEANAIASRSIQGQCPQSFTD